MPDQWRYVQDLISAYLSKKTKHRRLSQDNADRYQPVILRMLTTLREAGLGITPKTIGEEEIEYLLQYYAELEVATQKWMFNILNGWLRFYKNDVYKDMMITWPSTSRINVDWLTPEEAVRMLDAAQGVERIIIHLELRLWLRRCEVRRITLQDVQDGILDVHGKGRAGGKWRTLAWAPETREEVDYYEQLRNEMLARAREHHENSWKKGKRRKPAQAFLEPEEWVIYQKGRTAKGYGKTAIDTIVARVARRAGIKRHIGNHTLRRTGARLAYFAKVPLVEIMEALGHATEKETIKYLGLTVEELKHAQQKVFDYLQVIRAKMDLRAGEAVVVAAPTREETTSKVRVSK